MATTVCSRCGAPVPPNSRFCPSCGAVLGPASAGPAAPPPSAVPPTYAAMPTMPPAWAMEPRREEEHPTGSGILAIVGGLFILFGGIAELFFGSVVSAATFGQYGGILVGLGVLGILMGLLILILGILIIIAYENAAVYGILVIVFALVSLASFFGGFVIGFILALIGGILAITWKPSDGSYDYA